MARCSKLDHPVRRRFRCTLCFDTTGGHRFCYRSAGLDGDGDDCGGDDGDDDVASDLAALVSTVRSRTFRNPVLVT